MVGLQSGASAQHQLALAAASTAPSTRVSRRPRSRAPAPAPPSNPATAPVSVLAPDAGAASDKKKQVPPPTVVHVGAEYSDNVPIHAKRLVPGSATDGVEAGEKLPDDINPATTDPHELLLMIASGRFRYQVELVHKFIGSTKGRNNLVKKSVMIVITRPASKRLYEGISDGPGSDILTRLEGVPKAACGTIGCTFSDGSTGSAFAVDLEAVYGGMPKKAAGDKAFKVKDAHNRLNRSAGWKKDVTPFLAHCIVDC